MSTAYEQNSDALIKGILSSIKSIAPVEWDRYTQNKNDYNIFGWIRRSDGQRDFLLIQINVKNMVAGFITSSAKYSEEIHKLIFGNLNMHTNCQKINTSWEQQL